MLIANKCPFCGDVPRIVEQYFGPFHVECQCGALGPGRPSELEAVEAWDKRFRSPIMKFPSPDWCAGCETPGNERVNLPDGWKHGDFLPEGLTIHVSVTEGYRFAFRGDPRKNDRVRLP